MAVETELKLLLPPGAAAGVLRRPVLRSLLESATIPFPINDTEIGTQGPMMQRNKLHTTYFDTPDKWLAKRGMALRVRRVGRKYIQTLKAPAVGAAGTQTYLEVEAEIKRPQPELQAIDDEAIRRRLSRADIWNRLQPAFETRFQRAHFMLEREGSAIEVAVDHGDILAEGRRSPIAEIELELKGGSARALFDLAEQLALQLAEDYPVRLGNETKAARGFALAEGLQPVPHKAAAIDLAKDITTEDAFICIVRNCLDQLRANEAAVLKTEDDEAIHQFRVALRRLRAIASTFRDLIDDEAHAMLSIDLRWLQRQFGPARDLDVLIGDTLLPIQNRMLGQAGFEHLIETASIARAEARRTAHLAIENPRYVAMLIQLYRHLYVGGWRRASARARLSAPLMDFAGVLLQSRHKRLIRLGERHEKLPEPELHRLRILAKKMRYAAEAFHSLYRAKHAKRYISALAAIQDRLGSLNDAFVSRQLLNALVHRLVLEHGMAPADANLLQGLVLGWQAARIDRDVSEFRDVWRDFATQRRFWNGD
ncbi:MAG TPA: CHAD domain-containing protein [Dongiaceae bacterium]|jgi:inorganic triphosphatase YgiF